jgi:O-methyltransferase involved in polyketide biosynthesis
MISLKDQDAVAETLLIPLYCRALESKRADALMRDESAIRLVEQIEYDFTRIQLAGHDRVALILRVQQFDGQARHFLECNPDGVVVHIGCGLDTRFERVDNGQVRWYDLDLPEVIELRRKLLGETQKQAQGRAHVLATSVFETGWLEEIQLQAGGRVLFLAEGVFPYFEEERLKSLFLRLMEKFPGAELVCDAHTPFVLWMDNLSLAFAKMRARLNWGLKHPEDVEAWGQGIRLLDKWYYFDEPEPRLGMAQWMRFFPLFGKSTGIFHYRLGQKD